MSISTLVLSSIGYAGTMGDVSSKTFFSMPYLSVEGTYTWNQIKDININQRSLLKNNNGWGGRLAAGVIRPYTEKLSLTAEIGGGYYGSVKFRAPVLDVSGKNSIDGYDALVGSLYQFDHFGLFGAVGFMAQNLRMLSTSNIETPLPGGVEITQSTVRSTAVQILPEIKVGTVYNLHKNIDLSLAYLHVFGAGPKYTSNVTSSGTTVSIVNNSISSNPTLDTLLLGLRYKFV